LAGIWSPALLNAVSSRPNLETASPTVRATSSSLVTSHTTPAIEAFIREFARRLRQVFLCDVGEDDSGPCAADAAAVASPMP
jgi:hypothetical protein